MRDLWQLHSQKIKCKDCMHAKRVCKDFEISHVAKYCDLYPKSDALI